MAIARKAKKKWTPIMAQTDDAKRTAVANAYDGKAWKDKVKKMPEDQIVAIYMRLKLQGKIK